MDLHALIKPGIRGYKQVQVDSGNTASAFGSGLVEVFATPAMIALMEDTAQSSVQEFLSGEFTTVGYEVNIKHLKPTPVGCLVECTSLLISREGRKLCFELEARDEKGIIGKGTHTRYIIDRAAFMAGI